ncbi:MAG: methyltransferase [Patescibacteria group bacterium]|nr:methyltransferase [Patescibacteria group bacterium]MCL5095358.1 methyltransferase [Patescibacteria group bacterium]
MGIPKAKIIVTEGVNKTDYYSDTLLEYLTVFLGKTPKIHSLLEIGTGRGYLSIILAKIYRRINKIIATDIDDKAVNLARKNIAINNLQKKDFGQKR